MKRDPIPGFDYTTGKELSLLPREWAKREREAVAQNGTKGRDADGARWVKSNSGARLFEYYEDGEPVKVKGEHIPTRARDALQIHS